jgi:hypothetical protein
MHLRLCLAFAFLLAAVGTSVAQDNWAVSPLDPSSLPSEIRQEARQAARQGLPDGLVDTYDGNGDIVTAWYAGPTNRYRHGVLGDAVEASTLVVRTQTGKELSIGLPETEVFEDRYPRLEDLDGDGKVEVVTIRSSTSLGASVAVYGIDDNILVERASTEFIGRANRWLNIAGIASFRGPRSKEIAYVETPHIGGTLFIYEYAEGTLALIGSLPGFSNHKIGATELRLSAVADVNGDGRMDLALPSDDRRRLRIVGFVGRQLAEVASAELSSRIDKAIALRGSGQDVRFVVGLENGEVYEVHR